MAPDDNSGARPGGPVVLRIKLRYDGLDAMVQKFASNVGKSGLFLPTKSIQPVGTEVKFELRLANDSPVLVGLGRVKHVKPPDPANPKASFGMAIELMRVSREGREVIIRMLERRRALGLPEVAIPVPEDVESSRRAEVESHPRADTSGVVRDAMAQLASAGTAEPMLTAKPASGPIGVAKAPSSERASGPIATATERPSGPIATGTERPSAPLMTSARTDVAVSAMRGESSGRVAVPSLAPEKTRSRRPRVEELIDRAAELSSRIVVTDELDLQIDLDSVLTRARTLAGGDLDIELSTLREAAAAPIEISVEAASAELARQLGGKPIAKRDKSARWAPPPAIELRTELPAVETFSAKTRAETEAAPSAAIAAVVEAAIEEQNPAPEYVAKTRAQTEAPAEPAATDGELDVTAPRPREPELDVTTPRPREPSPSLVPQESYVLRTPSESEAITGLEDAVAEYDADMRTRIPTGDDCDPAFLARASASASDAIDPDTSRPRLFGGSTDVKTDPAAGPDLMIDDDADVLSFERALDAARIHTGVSAPAPERPSQQDLDPDDSGVLLASGEYSIVTPDPDVDPAPGESTQIGPSPAMMARDSASALGDYDGGDVGEEEVSDLDVLDEADEADADLLASAAPAAEPTYGGDPVVPPAYTQETYGTELGYGPDPRYPAESSYTREPSYTHEPSYTREPSYTPEPAYTPDPDAAAQPYTPDPDAAAQPYTPDPDAAAQPYTPDPAYAESPAHAAGHSDDFASRLDLGDDEDVPPPSDDIDRDAAREFDHEVASQEHAVREPDDDSARLDSVVRGLGAVLPDLGDDDEDDDDPARDFADPAREFDDVAREFDDDAATRGPDGYGAAQLGEPQPPSLPPEDHQEARGYGYQRRKRASSEPSTDYTFAEQMPQSIPQFAPHETGEDFDEPHGYAASTPAATSYSEPVVPVPAAPPRGPDPRLLRHGRATTAGHEDLEDALAALDVGDMNLEQQRRMRRPTPNSASSSRPLPGLPMERPRTGQVPVVPASDPPRVAHTVRRDAKPPTGQQSIVDPRTKPPTGQQSIVDLRSHAPTVDPRTKAPTIDPRTKSPTGQVRSGAKPPPIPAAARKAPTQQVPIIRSDSVPAVPVTRTPSPAPADDDGVLIDFDDDE